MIAEKEIKELLKQTFQGDSYKNGTTKWFKNRHPEIIDFLRQRYDAEDGNHTAAELCYCYLNDFDKIPKCMCGGKLRFKGFMHGYGDYCSEKCRYSDKEAQARAKIVRARTTTERFGVENVFLRKDFQDKAKAVKLEKYGDAYYSNHEQARRTMREKYGAETPGACPKIRKKIESTLMTHYGVTSALKSPIVKQRCMDTMRERYGVDYAAQNKEIYEKVKKTNMVRYGSENPLNNPEVKAKCRNTIFRKYGVTHYSKTREYHLGVRRRVFSRLRPEVSLSSTWEVMVYDYCIARGITPMIAPCAIPYESDGKIHHYIPDFSINGHLVEIKGDQFLKAEDDDWHMPYRKKEWTDEQYAAIERACKAKSECARRNGVIVLTGDTIDKLDETILPLLGDHTTQTLSKLDLNLHGFTLASIAKLCLSSPFPGTDKWPAENPIWDCHVVGKKAPKEAWSDMKLVYRAAQNMLTYARRSADTGDDLNLAIAVESALKNAFEGRPLDLLTLVLRRFSVARIAPKVTALPKSAFLRAVDESGLDISNGVYCPMAGFGGIIAGVQDWFMSKGLDYTGKIYAADINPALCKYYGWEQKDVLSEQVETDKTVVACPPFGDIEQWPGTPDAMYKTFEEWTGLIREHVKAPNYIFIGPPEDRKNGSLYVHRYQAVYRPEYSTPHEE